jgi:O-antigen/teichoic acid export membrane protein
MSTTTSSSSAATSTEIKSIVCELSSYVMGLLLTALLTNYLSATDYSRVVLGIYTLVLAYPLLLRGANKTIFTYLGQYFTSSTSTDANALLSWELHSIVYGALVFLILTAFTAITLYVFDPGFYGSGYEVILGFLCLAPLWGCLSIQGNVLLDMKQYKAYFVCNVVSQPLWCLIAVAFFVWVHGSLDYKLVLFAYFFSYIISVVGEGIWLKIQPNVVSFKKIWDANITATDKKKWRGYSVQLFINLELATLLGTVAVYLLEIFSSDANAAGTYNVVLNITEALFAINTALATIITPLISGNIQTTKGQAILQKLTNSINLIQLILGVAAFVVVYLFADQILGLFGAHYENASNALIIFTAISALSLFGANSLTILNYSGDVKDDIYINLFGVIFICIAGGVGSYLYGVTGMLIVTAVAYWLQYIIGSAIVRTKYNLKVMTFF